MLDKNQTVLAYGNALLAQGLSLRAMRHATESPAILAATAAFYTGQLAKTSFQMATAKYPPLVRLDLNVKVRNALKNAGITTVQELCLCTPDSLLKVPRIGSDSVDIISNELGRIGLTLRSDGIPYATRVRTVYRLINDAPVSVLHLNEPRSLRVMLELYALIGIHTIDDLVNKTSESLTSATTPSSQGRVLVFRPESVKKIMLAMALLNLKFKKE